MFVDLFLIQNYNLIFNFNLILMPYFLRKFGEMKENGENPIRPLANGSLVNFGVDYGALPSNLSVMIRSMY